MVERLVDRLAQHGDPRDDERTDEEEDEEQHPEHEGLDDGPGLLTATRVPHPRVEGTGQQGADEPHRREGEGGDVEERVARRDPQRPRQHRRAHDEGERDDDLTAPEDVVGVAVVALHLLDERGVDERAQARSRGPASRLLGSSDG